MADPVVHITAGVPDAGTGNITTLGMTINAIGSTTSGQSGPLAMGAVTTGAPTYTTAQTNPLSLTTAGLLRVDGSAVTQPISGSITVSGTTTVTGTVTANQGGAPWSENQTQLNGVALGSPSNYGTSPGAVSVQGVNAFVTNSVAVTGTFWQATQPVSGNVGITGTVAATQSGIWTVQPGNTPNTTAWLVTGTGGTFPVTGTFWQATQPVSIAATVNVSAVQSGTWTVQQGTPPWTVGGDTASGSADANNPVKIGGVARTSNPTAVTNGQRVNGIFDKLGKQVVVGALRDVKGVQKTSITTTTETTVVTAGTAGVFNDVYAIVVTNKSATTVYVDFKDATAGTTRMTLAAPANDTRGFTVAVDSAMVQAVAASNWTATLSGAATSIEITMLYVSNL
jgi:hypothetical protein